MLPTRANRRVTFNRGLIAETGIIPAGLQLIQDSYPIKVLHTKKIVVESVVNGKKVEEPIMRVAGLFQEGDIENANGRVYETEILADATEIIQEDIGQRAVYGEYDHPTDAKIHLDRISHGLTKIHMQGRKIFGEAEIIDNQPFGRCLRGLFERKWRVGISSRGIGDMEMQEGRDGKQTYRVMPGYQFVTWDAVAEPSVHGAILSPVSESIKKKLAPIQEAGRRSRAGTATRSTFLTESDYENLLLNEINNLFDISDIGPRRSGPKSPGYRR